MRSVATCSSRDNARELKEFSKDDTHLDITVMGSGSSENGE